MKNNIKGIIYFSKNIKDNDLFIKILSNNNEIISGMIYGGNSSKKKIIYQHGYFINFSTIQKNQNYPLTITGEICNPYIGSIFNNKYKLNALLSILSIINLSIVEGQKINGIFANIEKLITEIINKRHWIIFYCEWLFTLLKLIGYQVDYKNNINNKFYNLVTHEFSNFPNLNTIEFPHKLFLNNKKINYKNLSYVFEIFESIFLKNHLDNAIVKMPINYTNFKKLITKQLN